MTKILVKYYNKKVFLSVPTMEDTKVRLVEELLLECPLSPQEMIITDYLKTTIALVTDANLEDIVILSTTQSYF